MRFLKFILFLLLFVPQVRAANDQTIVTLTVTNVPAIANTLTVNSSIRTWTNPVVTASSQILTNPVVGLAATNLWYHIAANNFGGTIRLTFSSTNVIKFISNPGVTLNVGITGTWASLSTNFTSTAPQYQIIVPANSAYSLSTDRTNIFSLLIADLSRYASNSIAAESTGWTNFFNLSNIQTGGNKRITNSTLAGGLMTNADGRVIHMRYYDTNSGLIFYDSTPTRKYAIASGTNGQPMIFDVQTDFGIATPANYVPQPGAILSFRIATNSFGQLHADNIWSGTNAFGQITNSVIVGSTLTGNDYSGTIVSLSGGVVSDTVVSNSTATGTIVAGETRWTGDVSYTRVNNSTLANGANSAIDFGTTVYVKLKAGPTAAFSLDGINAAARDGRMLIIDNSTGQDLQIKNESGLEGTPANRITTGTGVDVFTTGNGIFGLIYDNESARWKMLWSSDSSGGSGAGGLPELNTIAELRARSVSLADHTVYVRGYLTINDGGEGFFVYDPSSSATDDGGVIISPNSGIGRWKRSVTGLDYYASWWGPAKTHTILQSAVDYVNSIGGGSIRAGSGAWLMDTVTPLELTNNVTIYGEAPTTVFYGGLIATNYSLIRIVGSTNVGIVDIALLSLQSTAPGGNTNNYGRGIEIIGSTNVTVRVISDGFYTHPVYVDRTSRGVAVFDSANQINSVVGFGAHGDGRDDSRFFMMAQQATVANGGGEIFVPSGTYAVNFVITNSLVGLAGVQGGINTSARSALVPYNGAYAVVTIGDDSRKLRGNQVRDIAIQSTSALTGSAGLIGINLMGGAFEATFNRVSVDGFASHLLTLGGSTNYPVSSVNFNDCDWRLNSTNTISAIRIRQASTWPSPAYTTAINFNGGHMEGGTCTNGYALDTDSDVNIGKNAYWDSGVPVKRMKINTNLFSIANNLYPVVYGSGWTFDTTGGTNVAAEVYDADRNVLKHFKGIFLIGGYVLLTNATTSPIEGYGTGSPFTHYSYPFVTGNLSFNDPDTATTANRYKWNSQKMIYSDFDTLVVQNSDGDVYLQPKTSTGTVLGIGPIAAPHVRAGQILTTDYGTLTVVQNTTNEVGINVLTTATYTTNAQQWCDASGVPFASVSSNGTFVGKNVIVTNGIIAMGGSGNSYFTLGSSGLIPATAGNLFMGLPSVPMAQGSFQTLYVGLTYLRPISGGNNIALRNGVSNQFFYIYGGEDSQDSTNYARIAAGYTGGNAYYTTQVGGTNAEMPLIVGTSGDNSLFLRSWNTNRFEVTDVGHFRPQTTAVADLGDSSHVFRQMFLDKTITAPGTVASQTINKLTGRVNFGATTNMVRVSNSLVSANSIITCSLATHDTTAVLGSVVAASGSFDIFMITNPTAETAVNFRINP